MLIDFRERGREGGKERGRQTSMWKTSIGSLLYMPQPGTKPAAWALALPGNWTYILSVYRTAPQPTEPYCPGPEQVTFKRWFQVEQRLRNSGQRAQIVIICVYTYIIMYYNTDKICYICTLHVIIYMQYTYITYII